jgi:dTDP-L-rhamnose 4-epimerase
MNVLVTGGAGFIGHHTANALAKQGCNVRVLDSLLPQVHTDPRESINRLERSVQFVSGDIRNHADVIRALEGVDAVYHFAAETGVGQSMYEIARYVDVNVRGTAVLCECMSTLRGKIIRLILASSRAVYGEGAYRCENCGDVYPSESRSQVTLAGRRWDFDCPSCSHGLTPRPTPESAPLHPISVYGITKQAQEQLCATFSGAFHVPTVILRFFNVLGPGQSLTNPYTGIASIFCSRMFAEESAEVYEDGAMLRDFVHVRDVVQANLKALGVSHPGTSVFNIGSARPLSVLRLAELLKEVIGSPSSIQISGRYRIGDIRHCWADIARARDVMGYEPEVSAIDALRDVVEYARSQGKLSAQESALDTAIDELASKGLTGVAGEKPEPSR